MSSARLFIFSIPAIFASCMNLQTRYDAMRKAAFHKWTHGEAELDAFIDSAQDDRRGISLVARPPAHIAAIIELILADFKSAEPTQYYYPATDIHLTILSIISCCSGFTLDMIAPADYQQAVGTILQSVRPFTISYSGLTASPGGIMVQGIPHDNSLEELRDVTRKHFQQSGLRQSIDQRYRINTAHSTVIRFRNKLSNPGILLEMVEKYQHHFIGSFEVNELDLMYNDWYQRANNAILLERYSLGGNE